MKRISIIKAIVAIAVVLAFVMPVTAFANVGTSVAISKNTVSNSNMEDELVAEKTVDTTMPTTRGTIYVDDDQSPGWYDHTHVRTIHEGVTNATAGDTVYVYNGIYYDHVTVNKKLSLVGESRDGVLVNGGGSGYVFYMTTPVTQVNISNFSITNGQYGIYIYKSSNNRITNCNIYTNTAQGIYIYTTSNNNIITNCNVYENAQYGIQIYLTSTKNVITNCNVHNNTDGIYFRTALSNNITNCNVYNNTNRGIYIYSGSIKNIINYCNIYENNYGILFMISSSNNNVTNCNLYKNNIGCAFAGSSSNCKVTNCDFYNNTNYGISLLSTSINNNITNCDLYNNLYGIQIATCSNSKLRGNTIHDNVYDFGVTGTTLAHFSQDIDPSNTVNGKPIYYLNKVSNLTLDETNNFGYLGLVSCKNITAKNSDAWGVMMMNTSYSTISNVTAHNGLNGIYVGIGSHNNNIINCDAYNNGGYGISLDTSSYNNITNSNIYNNTNIGFAMQHASYNKITNCNAYNNSNAFGIDMWNYSNYNVVINCTSYNQAGGIVIASYSTNNQIINCNAYNNKKSLYDRVGIKIAIGSNNNNIINCTAHHNGFDGIYFYYNSNNNDVINCSAYNNTRYGISLDVTSNNNNFINCTSNNNQYGIRIDYSTGNMIHHNNFVNNNISAIETTASSNTWDDGYPSGGNFWSDYNGVDEYSGPGQNISGSDGIGDTPYNISGGNHKDLYPLMVPSLDKIPPIITNVQAAPAAQRPNASVNITCTVTDNWNLIEAVKINISGPGGFTQWAPMNHGSSYYYNNSYITLGIYNYFIWANDTQGNSVVSNIYSFVVTDLDKPTSTVNPLPLWKKTTPFTITATASDNTAVVNVTLWYRYSSNGTSWTAWTSYGVDIAAPWNWSFTGTDGYYQFYSIAVDNYENIEDTPGAADASTGIDTVTPVTSAILTGTMGENNWYTSTVMVTLSATDTLSGIESRWYKVDAGFWTIYTAPFTVSGDSMHTVQYYSFDHAGNQENTTSVNFKIDTTAPTTTHTLQGLIGSQGWYVTNVTVTLSKNDVTSGVNYTKYKLNTGNWIVYTESFVVTTNGNYTLYYYSVDFAGNTEATKQAVFRIQHDVTPPLTTSEFDGIMGENNWFISPVTVTLNAVDNSAGVATTNYKLDAGLWTPYTGPFQVTNDAEHTLYYYSVDKVGNREENKSATLKIDWTPPTINLTVNKTGLMKWLLTATVSDETSGVAKVEFYLDGNYIGETTESPYEWNCTQKGTARAIVYDNAGNNAISGEVPVSQSVPQSQSSSSTLVSVSKDTIQGQSISSTLQRLFNLR